MNIAALDSRHTRGRRSQLNAHTLHSFPYQACEPTRSTECVEQSRYSAAKGKGTAATTPTPLSRKTLDAVPPSQTRPTAEQGFPTQATDSGVQIECASSSNIKQSTGLSWLDPVLSGCRLQHRIHPQRATPVVQARPSVTSAYHDAGQG